MNTRCVLIALTFSLILPRSVLAEESSCHDYPGHKEVLEQGRSEARGGGPSSHFIYDDPIEINGSRRHPRSVEVCTKEILESIKSGQSANENIENYAHDYFQQKKYGECHELLENVLNKLDEQERSKFYDIIAICYLLKEEKLAPNDESNYLEKIIGIANKSSAMNEYTKKHLEKISFYVAKATQANQAPISSNTYVDPEVTLRLGLLNLILGNKLEAVKYKDKVVSNFRKGLIFYPEQIKKDFEKAGLENLFQKNPNRYLTERQAFAFKHGKELMLNGATTLVQEVGNSADLGVIADRWVREMSNLPLDGSKQCALLLALPENSKKLLANPDFSIHTTDFAIVFKALIKRGWKTEAAKFSQDFFDDAFSNSENSGVEQISRYYFENKEARLALGIYSKTLIAIEILHKKGTSELLLAYKRLEPLHADLNKYKVSSANPVAIKTREVFKSVKHDYDIHKCLELAEDLTETGWKLLEQGKVGESLKLYKSAVDIRSKNLPANSLVLARTYKDAGRAAALADDFPFAEDCFKKALFIFSKAKEQKSDDFIITMESYGSLLNKNNRYDEAQKVYAKLKEIK